MVLESTKDRVPHHTAEDVNARIRAEMQRRVQTLQDSPAKLVARLRELDAEWDIERAIEANASTLAFLGVMLGIFHHPYWLALPALVTGFLFQHAIQGWCPPVPVLRRLGFRTAYEIDIERNALKSLRGDYEGASSSGSASVLAAEK